MTQSLENIAGVSYEDSTVMAQIESDGDAVCPIRYGQLALAVYNFDLDRLSVMLSWTQSKLIGRSDGSSRPPKEVPACIFSEDEVVITTQNPNIRFKTLRNKVEQLCCGQKGYGSKYGVAVFFEISRESDRGRVRAMRSSL